jgi:hypothetical protein
MKCGLRLSKKKKFQKKKKSFKKKEKINRRFLEEMNNFLSILRISKIFINPLLRMPQHINNTSKGKNYIIYF